MTNTIEVVLKVIDEMTGQIQAIAQGTEKQAESMSMSFTELNSALSLVKQGFAFVGEVIDATAGKSVEYNKSILDLSMALGTTTEETSRIVQVMDDFGISQETVESALSMMTKNGLQPTIENLADLSDEFLSIQDPVERAQRMTELLGRNWTALVPALNAGGSALEDMAAGVSSGLVVTEKSAKAAESYRLAVDDLNDSWDALTMTLGQQVLPVLTTVTSALADIMSIHDKNISSIQTHAEDVQTLAGSYGDYLIELERSVEVAGFHLDAEGYMLDAYNRRHGQIQILSEAEFDLAQLQADVVTPSVQGMADAYADVVQHYDPLLNGFEAASGVLPSVTDLMEKYNDKLLFNIAVAGLDRDAAIELAKSMGYIDEKTALAYDVVGDYTALLDSEKMRQNEFNLRLGIARDLLSEVGGKEYTTKWELEANIDKELYAWYDFLDDQNQSGGSGGGEQEAAGGSWTIPGGYGYEGFYLGAGHYASPGETVTVTPAGGEVKASGGVTIQATIITDMDYEELLYRLRDDIAHTL